MLQNKKQRQNFLTKAFLFNILSKIEKILFASQKTIFFKFWVSLES